MYYFLTYLIEVIIYKEFTYFPYAIFLMIFPIGLRIILYFVRSYCIHIDKKLKEIIEEMVKHYKLTSNAYQFISKEDLTFEMISVMAQLIHDCSAILNSCNNFRDHLYFNQSKLYYQIFSIICWLISFSTLLYYIL